MATGQIAVLGMMAWPKIQMNHGFRLIGGWLSAFGPVLTALRQIQLLRGFGYAVMPF